MKKFANFIINKRFVILFLIGLLSIGSLFFISKVNINKDMTKYLPDDSTMKQGLIIVQDEFPDNLAVKEVKVMFKGLAKDKISEVIETLKSVNGIDQVIYNDSESYNKDEYTLFSLQTKINFNTPEEEKLEQEIAAKFTDYPLVIQHADSFTSTIPFIVLVIAITVLTVILFVMCNSWIEPFLFLATIGIAVLLNFGSNIFLGEISQTTFSMSAILQLVLSMDYSIILMNRYRQEKKTATSNLEAMKNAYANSFSSILGSALTTILGLLVLCFMSFKIGADLGIVMAKGVALSMLCVFTILPTLILLFDKLIEKTTKKTLSFKMEKVSKFEHKHHFALTIFFVVVIVSSFYLQNNTRISFAPVKNDQIGEIFPAINQTILVYDNKDEQNIQKILSQLSAKDEVLNVLGYGNTLGANLTVDKMSEAFGMMGNDFKIDKHLLQFVYYDFYKGTTVPKVSIGEFYEIITEQLAKEEIFSDYFTEDVKLLLDQIKPFMSKKNLEKIQTVKYLEDKFQLERSEIAMLLGLYFAGDNTYTPSKLNINSFVKIIMDDVLTNPIFKDKIPEEMKPQLELFSKITNKDLITVPLTANIMAQQLGASEADINKIYTLKFGIITLNKTMTIAELAEFVVNEILPNEAYQSQITQEMKDQMNLLYTVTNATITNKLFTVEELAEIIPIDKDPLINQNLIKTLFIFNEFKNNSNKPATSIRNLVVFINSLMDKPKYSGMFTPDKKTMLKLMDNITYAVITNQTLTSSELYKLLQPISDLFSKNMLDLLYLYNGAMNYFNPNWTMTIDSLLDHLVNNVLKDTRFEGLINQEIATLIKSGKDMVDENKNRLVGTNHSLILIETNLAEDSAETTAFFEKINNLVQNNLQGDYYFVGNSAMSVEMEQGFKHDLWLITILTALTIFIVIMLTFKSLIIPLVLVLIVQCAVFITVFLSGFIGGNIYFLALLVVQCILMGATVDYGIVYTNYYIENRRSMDIIDAVKIAYQKSLHTILTSGLIIILVTGFIGLSPTDPAIAAICITLSLGTLAAVLLIIFILPGLLALFDKKIMKKRWKLKLAIDIETDENIEENNKNVDLENKEENNNNLE